MKSISATIERALASAGLDPRAGALGRATETVRKALAAAGLVQAPTRMPQPAEPPRRWRDIAPVFDRSSFERPAEGKAETPAVPAVPVGQFTTHSFSIGSTQRDYKLYVPSLRAASNAAAAMPLIVMLHGCKQNPDDFASGTRMNELAEQHGFLVAYPAQSIRANGANCWNWFEPAEQAGNGEETSLIAGIVREIGQNHRVDQSRVFVAGLSAGAAMAVILGARYPQVFSAVGVHSGLALGSAHDAASAFAAMRGMPTRTSHRDREAESPPAEGHRGVAAIVFHGDRDATVSSSNGDEVAEQAKAAFEARTGDLLRAHVLPRQSLGGREATTKQYLDASGRARVEQWLVHGGSHAWSGGSVSGSFADPTGPDASSEIVRFFLEQRARA